MEFSRGTMMKLKTLTSLCVWTALTLTSSVAMAQDLMITAVFDGPLSGGTPKGVQLTVLNDIADLSTYGLGSANNGGGSDGQEFTFPADSASAGDKIYVATEANQFQVFFGFAPNYTDGSMAINGDDAIEVFHNGAVIDVFGDIDVDGNGQPWEYVDGWAMRYADFSTPSTTFDATQWAYSGVKGLRGGTNNATAATPLPSQRPSKGGNGGPASPAPVAALPVLLLGFAGALGLGLSAGRRRES